MKQIAKAVLAVASLVALASAGAAGVRAAEPTLGATIQSRVYIDQGGDLVIWNRSTVEARFTFIPSGGWIVQPDSVVLQPDETATVNVSGTGDDGAKIAVRVAATEPPPHGVSATELLLTSRVFLVAPFDVGRLLASVLPWLAAAAMLAYATWRTKPWTVRLTRAGR